MSVRFDPSSSSATTQTTVTPSTPQPPTETEKTKLVAQKKLCPGPECSKPATKLCSRCKAISYCSAECQKADWKTHQKACIPINAPKEATPEKKENPVDALWKSIEATTKFWLGGGRIETLGFGSFENSSAFWSFMAKDHQGVASKTFVEAAEKPIGKGVALDLGCGNGAFSLYLLYRGWKVVAVDIAKGALDILEKQANLRDGSLIKTGKLRIVHQDVNEFDLSEKFDVIIANDVLPYLNPSKLRSVWDRIHNSLEPNGLFMGSLLYRSKTSSPLYAQMVEFMTRMGANFIDGPQTAEELLKLTGYKTEIFKIRYNERVETTIDFVARKPA